MTKRFTVPVKYRFSHSKIQLNGEPLTNDELVRILNTNDGAFTENFALKQENEQLKFERDRYKRLSEIRQESINNRILTIKEFIDNCSDNKVKKTLEQLFHSEVKEYDLSKKIRKLEKENEQLKEDIENLKITIKARETLIDVCEKKFNELGYIITVDDDGYVIE